VGLAADLPSQCRLAGLPAPLPEYPFARDIGRRWRIDFAWVDARLALEVEGAVWTRGRHTRPRGFLGDIDKYNALALRGWRLLRATPAQVNDGTALAWLKEALT
jgi:very-short-patch-repair endonuclease